MPYKRHCTGDVNQEAAALGRYKTVR